MSRTPRGGHRPRGERLAAAPLGGRSGGRARTQAAGSGCRRCATCRPPPAALARRNRAAPRGGRAGREPAHHPSTAPASWGPPPWVAHHPPVTARDPWALAGRAGRCGSRARRSGRAAPPGATTHAASVSASVPGPGASTAPSDDTRPRSPACSSGPLHPPCPDPPGRPTDLRRLPNPGPSGPPGTGRSRRGPPRRAGATGSGAATTTVRRWSSTWTRTRSGHVERGRLDHAAHAPSGSSLRPSGRTASLPVGPASRMLAKPTKRAVPRRRRFQISNGYTGCSTDRGPSPDAVATVKARRVVGRRPRWGRARRRPSQLGGEVLPQPAVEGSERSSEQEQPRRRRQRPAQRDPLLLPADSDRTSRWSKPRAPRGPARHGATRRRGAPRALHGEPNATCRSRRGGEPARGPGTSGRSAWRVRWERGEVRPSHETVPGVGVSRPATVRATALAARWAEAPRGSATPRRGRRRRARQRPEPEHGHAPPAQERPDLTTGRAPQAAWRRR